MPYRRLPNTDKSRLTALEQILKANQNIEIFDFYEIREIRSLKREYELLLKEYENLKKKNKKQAEKYNKAFSLAKLYIHHFIQVFFMAIARGEISESYKKIYDLSKYGRKLPDIKNFDDLSEWYKKISDGEQKRIFKGGKAMTNPSIGEVASMIEICKDEYIFMQQLKNKYINEQDKLKKFRKNIDEKIKSYWDKIEKYFAKYPTIIKIEKTKKFGLRYFYRSGEDKIELKDLLN